MTGGYKSTGQWGLAGTGGEVFWGETEPGLEKTSSWPRKGGKGHGPERSTTVDAEHRALRLGGKGWRRGKEVTEGGVGGEKTRCVTLGCPLTDEAHRAEGCSGGSEETR